MIKRIKLFNREGQNREKSYYIYSLVTFLLAVTLVFLLAGGLFRYYQKDSNAQKMGKNVVYSISQDKILSASPILDVTTIKASAPVKAVPPTNNIAKNDTNNNNPQPAAEVAPKDNKPVVAILVTGVGLSSSSTAEVEKLPSSVTFGLSPYTPDLAILAKKLSDSKHDLFINIPLEPSNYPEDDPGPYGLLTSLTNSDNIERLHYLINKTSNIIGVYSIKGEKFTSNDNSIKSIIDELKTRNLLYVYGGDNSNVVIGQVAQNEKFNLISIDYTIDDEITEENITTQLDLALQKAKKTGFATIISHPYPISIFHLQKWIDALPNQNINVVGFGEIAQINKKN
jgi:polysaccharide deacetylase 2 family uncharacterized protein YibQ